MIISLQAIEFLSRAETFRSHAVHFAIALFKMQLLLLPDSIQAQLCKFKFFCYHIYFWISLVNNL